MSAAWTEALWPEPPVQFPHHHRDAFRSALHEDHAGASDAEIDRALGDILRSMSPAESFNFSKALDQIGRTASNVVSDPTFGAVAGTALPILGGALGTYFGPAGTAVGSQLGSMAAQALPTRGRPGAGVPPAPRPPVAPPPPAFAAMGPAAPTAAVAAPAAGGSTAAAQAAVLSQQPQMLSALLAAALGANGRREVGGVPVAQLLGLMSQTLGRAAAEADELHYLEGGYGAGEDLADGAWFDSDQALYEALMEADDIELADALESEGFLDGCH